MKTGDLAEVIVPIPTLFESVAGDLTCIIKSGDVVVLLEYVPATWPRPHWKVVYGNQVGFVASRWLRPLKDRCDEYLVE